MQIVTKKGVEEVIQKMIAEIGVENTFVKIRNSHKVINFSVQFIAQYIDSIHILEDSLGKLSKSNLIELAKLVNIDKIKHNYNLINGLTPLDKTVLAQRSPFNVIFHTREQLIENPSLIPSNKINEYIFLGSQFFIDNREYFDKKDILKAFNFSLSKIKKYFSDVTDFPNIELPEELQEKSKYYSDDSNNLFSTLLNDPNICTNSSKILGLYKIKSEYENIVDNCDVIAYCSEIYSKNELIRKLKEDGIEIYSYETVHDIVDRLDYDGFEIQWVKKIERENLVSVGNLKHILTKKCENMFIKDF